MNSTIGYLFHLGFGPISWISKMKSIVSLSSNEVEYHAIQGFVFEEILLCHILFGMDIPK